MEIASVDGQTPSSGSYGLAGRPESVTRTWLIGETPRRGTATWTERPS